MVLVFASAAVGAACSNSSQGQESEETTAVIPFLCNCISNPDGSVSIVLDGSPDGCDRNAGCAVPPPVVLPPPPVVGTGM
jgi:hypothetical protein